MFKQCLHESPISKSRKVLSTFGMGNLKKWGRPAGSFRPVILDALHLDEQQTS